MAANNPYETPGRDLVESVVGGERREIGLPCRTLSDRLRAYAFFRMESATEASDALLVSDLLDAAKLVRASERPTQEDTHDK